MLSRRRVVAFGGAVAGLVTPFPVLAQSTTCDYRKDFDTVYVEGNENWAHVHSTELHNNIGFEIKTSHEKQYFVLTYRTDQVRLYDDEPCRAGFSFDDGAFFDATHVTLNTPGTQPQRRHRGTVRNVNATLVEAAKQHDWLVVTLVLTLASRQVVSGRIPLKDVARALAFADDKIRDARENPDCEYKPASGGCLLTTACVEEFGLTDACFELRALRKLRDHTLRRSPQGADLVALYYQMAPKILANLDGVGRHRVLRALYARYVLPSVVCSTLGLTGMATRIYAHGTLKLLRMYAPEDLEASRARLKPVLGTAARRWAV